MPIWSDTVVYLFVSTVIYTFAAVGSVYLFLRHVFLLTSALDPFDFSVWNCLRVCASHLSCDSYRPALYDIHDDDVDINDDDHEQQQQQQQFPDIDLPTVMHGQSLSIGGDGSSPINANIDHQTTPTDHPTPNAKGTVNNTSKSGTTSSSFNRNRAAHVASGSMSPTELQRKANRKRTWMRAHQSGIHGTIAFYSILISSAGFTFLCIGSCLLRLGNDGVRLFPWISGCSVMSQLLSASWMLAKTAMYGVFTAHLFIGFERSAFAYPSWLIWSMYVAITLFALSMVVWIFVSGHGEREHPYRGVSSSANTDQRYYNCNARLPDALILAVSSMDVLCAVLYVCLFTRQLRKLFGRGSHNRKSSLSSAQRKRAVTDPGQATMQLLPVKYTIICSIAVISTFISLLIFAVGRGAVVVVFDALLNMLCLYLLTALWRPAYIHLCGPILYCASSYDSEMRHLVTLVLEHFQVEKKQKHAFLYGV